MLPLVQAYALVTSQSPLIGSRIPTPDCSLQSLPFEYVAIPSNRVKDSYADLSFTCPPWPKGRNPL